MDVSVLFCFPRLSKLCILFNIIAFFLYNSAVRPLICEGVGILLACGKHLHSLGT